MIMGSIWKIVLLAGVILEGVASQDTYDFIVVGGGVGGCTVASRLSERGPYNVLLLEMGGYPDPGLDVPALWNQYIETGLYSHSYKTQNGNGRVKYLVGKTLGGGSSINGMAFNRGNPRDFDRWAVESNDTSWRYENFLSYFKKVENYMGDWPNEKQHGYRGPITVSRPRYAPGLGAILEAGKYLNYTIADQNGPQQISFTALEFSKRFGRRVSSYTGYLKPLLDIRPNLKVVTRAKVEKVIFDKDRRAVSVSYNKDGVMKYVNASREIVLAGGAIETPAILLRSGIGPSDHLKKVGIPLVQELPVGQNLMDHTLVNLPVMINDSSQVFVRSRDLTTENYIKYNTTGDGPYSLFSSGVAQAFMATSLQKGDAAFWADIQIQFSHSASDSPPADIKPGEVAVTCMIFLVRPNSRGFIVLNETDPSGDPVIDFQYLTKSHDTQMLIEGIEKTLQIYEGTPAMQRLGGRFSSIPLKQCSDLEFRSRQYWKCFVENKYTTGLHAAGSCKMGAGAGDPTAVVDPELRVIGVRNLRISDASVMPFVPNANTQASIYAFSEKLVDLMMKG